MLKLNFESRTVAPSVSSGSLFASQIDFLRMEVKPFRFHKTERANNHIKQGDTLFFAHNPIGVTYNRLPAMLTNAIHVSLERQGTCHMLTICPKGRRRRYVTIGFLSRPKNKSVDPSHRWRELPSLFNFL